MKRHVALVLFIFMLLGGYAQAQDDDAYPVVQIFTHWEDAFWYEYRNGVHVALVSGGGSFVAKESYSWMDFDEIRRWRGTCSVVHRGAMRANLRWKLPLDYWRRN